MSVNNGQNIIDSRDIIERIDELEDERSSLEDALSEAQEAWHDAQGENASESQSIELQSQIDIAEANVTEWAEGDDAQELKVLKALAEEAGGASDWVHGESLIRDSYFEEYAEQLAADIGAIDRNARWPVNCIDWAKAAGELQSDYTSVDFDSVTYWIRS